MASNYKLLQTGKYSDLTVKCGSREWRVHRSIVCEGSKFFAAACDGPFLVSVPLEKATTPAHQAQESSSREVTLEDDDPAIFERLLLYLYTLDYDDGSLSENNESPLSENSPAISATQDPEQGEAVLVSTLAAFAPDEPSESQSDSSAVLIKQHATAVALVPERPTQNEKSSLMINVQVYAMAEKFDVAELKILAKEKFSACAQGWPLPEFPSVVHEALSSTPESDRGLRDLLSRILAEHVEEICPTDESFGILPPAAIRDTRQQWCTVLREEGRFLYEVLGTVAANKADEEGRLRMTNLDVVADLQNSQEEVMMLKTRMQQLKRENSALEADLEAVKARGARLVQEIDTRDHCRHCSHAFQPSFEDLGSYDEWWVRGTLRCKKCRTKHSF